MGEHTPGPWQWDVRTNGALALVHPHRGWLIVMDFVRLGMQSGTARFAEWKGDDRLNMGGIMKPAHQLDLANHPDARLIAAAPCLLEACEHVMATWAGEPNEDNAALSLVRAAVAKATKGTP